jgi:hypothetical protein
MAYTDAYSVNTQVITIPGSLFENGQDANNLWPTPIALTVN